MDESWESQLRRAVGAAPTERERAVAVGRLGVALAQAGKVGDAKEMVEALRDINPVTRSNWVSIYLLLLEGLVLYYESRSAQSKDRIFRARTLARATGYTDLEAEISVWQSMISYNFDDYSSLESCLEFALDHSASLSNSLKARLAGQIGDLLQVVGRFQVTGEWYSVARKLARAAHDHPLVAAIEYNRLAVGLTRYRYDEILDQFRSNSIDRKWEIEYESVKNLQIGFRNEALTDLLEVCDARYKHVCGQNGGAAEILRALRARGAVALSGSSAMAFDAEIAWYDALAGRSCSDLSEMIRVLDGVESSDISENIDLVFFVRELMHLAGVSEGKPLIDSLMRRAVQNLMDHIRSIEICIECALGRGSGSHQLLAVQNGLRS